MQVGYITGSIAVSPASEGSGDAVFVPADAFVFDRVLETVFVVIEA